MTANRQRGLRAALALTLVVAGCASTPAGEASDPALREAVFTLPVPGMGAGIVVTAYRPPGAGPFPWILLSHGTAPDAEANRRIGRYRQPALVHEWLRRGWAVVVPVRRGYGASGGERPADSFGSCARPDFARAGEAAALDLRTAIDWARSQTDLDAGRWLLVGQSAGGFASIVTAAQQPPGLAAVLAFAPGRGGNPATRPGAPCAADRLADLFASVAPRISVPVLWFYAENDQYIGPTVQRLWFERFRAAGGQGRLVVVPPFRHRLGHGVVTAPEGIPLWTAAVHDFLHAYRPDLPFARP